MGDIMQNSLEIYLNPSKQRLQEPGFYEAGVEFYKKFFYYIVNTKEARYIRMELPVSEVLKEASRQIFNDIFQSFNYVKESYSPLDLSDNGMLESKITVVDIEPQTLCTMPDNSSVVVVGILNIDKLSYVLMNEINELPFTNLNVSVSSEEYGFNNSTRFGIHDYKAYFEATGLNLTDIVDIKRLFLEHFTGKTSPDMIIYLEDGSEERIGW